MYRPLKIFLLLTLCGTSAFAQTLEEGRALLTNEQYDEALPIFQKIATQQPANATAGFLYGECLLKTGKTKESLKYLDNAVRRKVPDAALYQGEAYEQLYYFDKALFSYNAYRTSLTLKKKPTAEVDKLIAHCKIGHAMMTGVEKVCVIDSFVVDKASFLSAYCLSKECGHLYTYKDFFKTDETFSTTVHETELGNRILYGNLNNRDKVNLVASEKSADGWSAPALLPGAINSGASNVNYPYLMSDGITIYYASDGAGSLGGYDIFVTRYNTESDSYLKPENIGMPFNSPFDDYMLVIDETNNLGWFASDRYQPADKVCVYVFVPNETKQIYDSKTLPAEKLIDIARLSSVQSTWFDQSIVDDGAKRLAAVVDSRDNTKSNKGDFTFVIDGSHTYHADGDFHSPAALQAFKQLQSMKATYADDNVHLSKFRNDYRDATSEQKRGLAPTILKLEKEVLSLENSIDEQTLKVRNVEIKELNKQ
jgi:tetratricopeptide (TPR) repeat protein